MLPTLQIGSLAIQTPGLILLIGVWFALDLSERQAILHKQQGGRLFSLLIYILAGGIIGARLVYAAGNMEVFSANPLGVFSLSPLLLNVPGGFFFAAAAGLAYGQRHKILLWPTLDALTIAFAILMIAFTLSNFASGDAYGRVSSLPWALRLWGEFRHPTQVYETLAALFAAAIVWPRQKGKLDEWLRSSPGLRFSVWLALSAASRLFLEAFRANSPIIFGQYREPQVFAWLVLALSLWLIYSHGVNEKNRLMSPNE